jgi:hypothetical protein
MLFRFHSHFTVLLISTLVLAGCGGGGGSSSPTSPPQGGASPPASDFVPGVFADSRVLAAQCINPRSGLDHNGIPFLDVQGTALDENQWIRSYSNETYLWYDEIIDIDPAGYGNPLVYFDLMVTPELSPTGNPKDKFHFTYSTEEFYEEVEAGIWQVTALRSR